jgi:hypothetical protein
MFDRFDNFAIARVATDALGADLDRSGLIDRARIDGRACYLFNRYRLAGDAGLVEKGMTAQYRAINRHATARIDEHSVTDLEIVGIDIAHRAAAANRDRPWQEVEKVMDRSPAARDGHAFEHFGHQHEQRNDEGGEELSDRGRSDNRNAHGELHGHPPCYDVFGRLLENWPAAYNHAQDTDDAHARKRLPDTKPHRRRGQRDERDAGSLRPREGILAVILIVVVVVRLGCRDRCARLALVGDARTDGRIFKDSHREFLHFR